MEPESTDIPFGLIEWPLIDSRLHERERIVLTMMRALNHQYPGTTSSETDLANYMGYSKAELRFAITRLIKRGYVRRSVALANDRAVPVYQCVVDY